MHYSADLAEIIHYHDGPGAWGGINEPVTLAWQPKGVSHHGPSGDVPEGYLAFVLEPRSTPRITEFARKHASVMSGTYEKFRGTAGWERSAPAIFHWRSVHLRWCRFPRGSVPSHPRHGLGRPFGM